MQIFKQVEPLKAYLKQVRSAGNSIGLVPTMGALHNGHLSLVQRSKRENSSTVCSIFVNPAQFNNSNDLLNYPRTLDKDLDMLREAQCDVAFCPDTEEMYSNGARMAFDFGPLDKVLEGEFRPGHFSGVALVVSKLFHIIEPDRAYFGLKDYQQFKIISRLVRELKFNVDVVGLSIVREADGLALSSRNRLLNPADRPRAATLYQCLKKTKDGLLQGRKFPELKEEAMAFCNQSNVKLEYLALADADDLSVREHLTDPSQSVLLIAAYVGSVRLIDNLLLIEPTPG